MTFLLVLAAVFVGGVGFGIVMLVGVMLYEGKWTLPNTAARRAQELRVRAAVEEFDIQSEIRRQELEVLYERRAGRALGPG